MKISVNALKFINEHYGSAGDPAPNGVDDLVEKIGAQLGAVEEVISFGKRLEGVLIARVVSCTKHHNADKLKVCMIDDGGKAETAERNESGLVQVVCGAPNVQVGMLVAWIPPGATVPSTYDKEPLVLDVRDLRGVKSNGMLASPKELSLSDNHDGILEIHEDIAPGTPFVDATHLRDDQIIDIENKMFTHRPDCFGWLGIAREVEGMYHRPYKSPAWYTLNPEFPKPAGGGQQLPLEVRNEIPELVPRFVAVAMSDIKIEPSPLWLQVDLARIGMRSINNIVDYTNFYMVLTGQPIHAYDYDKVKAVSAGDTPVLTARYPQKDEKITLLSGKEITPRPEAIMIATDKQLIGVAGVMGGADTEVDASTKNIIIEVANFDMYSIRRTSMEHGLFTDAVARFNKGQSPLQNLAVAAKLVDQIVKNGHGRIASPVIDDNHLPKDMLDRGSMHPPVVVTQTFINERLGLELATSEMVSLLANVEFSVQVQDNQLTVLAPFWRTDIEIPEDVVEEVGRLYGYDHLSLKLPMRDLTPATRNPALDLKSRIRTVLSSAGANEVLTYTFVHSNLIDKAGQNKDLAFQLSNALSPDLQYYRLSLTPSLLEKVHPNIKADYVRGDDNEFALFEINKVHNKQEATSDEEGLPRELSTMALVFAADDKTAQRKYTGAPYYQAKKYLATLLDSFGAANYVKLVPLDQADLYDNQWAVQAAAPFEPKRSAALMDDKGLVWGVVGEYRRAVKKALKLPGYSAGFEFDPILLSMTKGRIYEPLGKFPKTQQDISFKVSAETTYQQLFDLVQAEVGKAHDEHGYMPTLAPVDIYQAEADQTHKNITLRLWLHHPARTLTTDEVNTLLEHVAKTAQQSLQAERL